MSAYHIIGAITTHFRTVVIVVLYSNSAPLIPTYPIQHICNWQS